MFKEITDDFERQFGHKLLITYAAMGAIGESADLVVGSTSSIASLVKGKIHTDSQLTICKVGVGVVVPSGTPKPARPRRGKTTVRGHCYRRNNGMSE